MSDEDAFARLRDGGIDVVLPGPIDTPTGGYGYDRELIHAWRHHGIDVRVHELPARFPWPDERTVQRAVQLFAGFSDGSLVLADGLAFSALPDVVTPHARRLPMVALIHHPLALETGLTPAQRQCLFDAERRALAAATHVVTTSHHTAGWLVDHDVPRSRISIVVPGTPRHGTAPAGGQAPTPIAPTRSSASTTTVPPASPSSAAPDAAPSPVQLLCVATLTPRKNHTTLLSALASTRVGPPWHLTCVGSDTLDPACARLVRNAIRTLGLQDHVTLTGAVSADRLQQLYRDADVFVLPSRHEGYGMVFAEALAHGLPVIGTTAGAVPEVVPRQAGALIDPDDASALSSALAHAIGDPLWRRSAAQAARNAATGLPDWPVQARAFASVLRRCGTDGPSAPGQTPVQR